MEHEPHELTLKVATPRWLEPHTYTWPWQTLVGAAAEQAARDAGMGGTPTFAVGDRKLDRNQTLHQAELHNNEEVEVVDVGGGV